MKSHADSFRWYWRTSNRLEALVLRRLGTSGSNIWRRGAVLLLETTGRQTGRRRRAPVVYWKEGESFFVGGGAAGMTRVDWVANLRADQRAAVWIRRERISVVACLLTGEAEERARATAFAKWPNAPKYEARSGRRIPYFRLDPESPKNARG